MNYYIPVIRLYQSNFNINMNVYRTIYICQVFSASRWETNPMGYFLDSNSRTKTGEDTL